MPELSHVTWKRTLRGGGIGEPVAFEMLTADVEEMRAWWRRIDALPTGAAKTIQLAELRLLMDVFATFEGTTLSRRP